MPAVLQKMLEVSDHKDLDAFAAAHGLSADTVRSWDKRGSVPASRIKTFAERYLMNPKEFEAPNLVHQTAPMEYSMQPRPATLYRVEEGPPPWKLPLLAEDGTRLRGASNQKRSDLLVSKGSKAVLPLLLSLPLGQLGAGETKEYEVIPKRVMDASAGTGQAASGAGDADKIDLVGELAFSFQWLRENLGHTSGQLSTVQVRGDSMSPTLIDGETIMIDEAVASVEVDGIYVLDLYGRRLVKRVQHLFDGTLVLISENERYAKETIPRDQARDVRVIGRMVWPRVR